MAFQAPTANVTPMADVRGKTAFVTGGANGIGLGIVQALVKAGANVVIADIRQSALDEAKAALNADAQVETVQLDVTDRAAFAAAADRAEARFGKIHMLIGNAGIGVMGPVLDARYDDWDWGMGVNLGGVINGLVTILPRIKAHGEGGQIVTTSSQSALIPISYSAIYTAAKAAVMGISEAIRGELAVENIGVSAFMPGPVQSNISQSGELRPQHLRNDSGYAQREADLEKRPNSPLWMSAEEVGERVLAGIQRNDLYILTHPEFGPGMQKRFDAIMASVPSEPVNEARAKEIFFLLDNPVFDDQLARRAEANAPQTEQA
ncbi:SDR family NAD(P)-dependent oxidoreductase [Novosphingobium sp. FSY-8]|uniref:SDR family NAD(P)-dependent oxidoreductase n=1 Tax=Novosphingobium ovatum TaxID=1908523 RepID=A0ABW9X8U8_9SPHN|nr:SDR family NAD(P)-dependent oxidoreductase [Novosphingobium ovatum]NBC34951.1 SDR family NAD(P)-dependent oxidoreductase [Novosphingobium ovatum]